MIGLVLLPIYLMVTLFEGDITVNGLAFYWDKMRLCNPSWAGLWRMMLRYIIGVIGSFGLIFSMKLATRKYLALGRLSYLGTTTLGVYFLHRYFVLEWCRIQGGDAVGFWMYIPLSIVCFYVCHYMVLVSRRVLILNLCLWGPGFLFKNYLQQKRIKRVDDEKLYGNNAMF